MARSTRRFTHITALHIVRLVYRCVLFLTTAVFYILERLHILSTLFGHICSAAVWVIFIGEMFLRFFPSNYESMGCQKQFRRNYSPTAAEQGLITQERRQLNRGAAVSLAAWLALNALIAYLYLSDIIDSGMMMLVSLAFSVCDMICILFFCPFQSWIMKNRCCVTCRIYNWDYAMMFTPLLFVRGFFSRTLVLAAIALLARWEIAFYLCPERFLATANACLDCSACNEKLCRHKKSIQKFLIRQSQRLFK